jgi:hypothetical protein
MASRFSKKSLTDHLQARVSYLQKEWGFDPANGTAQIPHIARDRQRTNPLDYIPPDETPEQRHLNEANRVYGEIGALMALVDHFDLEVSQTKDLTTTYVGPKRAFLRYR